MDDVSFHLVEARGRILPEGATSLPDEVFAVLRVVDDWPLWWPGVRRARRIDEQSGAFLLPSLLPFDLHLTITGAFEDTESRVLRGVVGGDLEGVSGWSGGQEARRARQEDRRPGTRSE
ncbi:hypothetical protein SMIR_00395 [Streptomyces mirabilis]|uniref:hypothetical protein n=1 Tax=Streptomyces mirabilis TaxID=68239 RepID=UPI001BAED21A|nr:hypothetical protein [Streptomyces mirabilis]QUW85365.1 hypothetical protein SMIR_00395 [Streptomyces mirabilis]